MTIELPVVDPTDLSDPTPRRGGRVVGVVLAAGGSERFGDANKLLADVDGVPMIRRSVEPYHASRLDDVLVVVGDDAPAVTAAIDAVEATVVRNEALRAGQSTSVIVGLEAATRRGADAVVFGLGDMPWIDSETIDLLIDAYRRSDAPVIAAAYEGDRGNPVLFAEATFDELLEVEGDTGGREVLAGRRDAIALETADPGVRRDVDRREDLANST